MQKNDLDRSDRAQQEVEVEVVNVVHHEARTTRNESIPRWSRSARFALGAITFVLIALFAGAGLTALLLHGPVEMPSRGMAPVQVLAFLATFAEFLLVMFYLSFAAQNPRTKMRGLWMASMIAMPFAALPLYWWVHVWRAPYVANPRLDYNVPGGQLTPQAD